MKPTVKYKRGLHELGDGLFAYLQPDGGWGWSNAGLITASGVSLLVDTLFDLKLTQQMLEAMAPVLDQAPLEAAVNTHGNGDHCFGNQLLPERVPIYATTKAAAEMEQVTPALLHTLFNELDLGPEFAAFARESFGGFTFDGIELRLPSSTFDETLDLTVGGRPVQLIAVGPAHTPGDAIAYVPSASAVFTGDVLFSRGTPIMWAGPVSNWLAASDRVLALEPDLIVPGHGPLAEPEDVRAMQHYLSYVERESRRRFDDGMTAVEAADDIDLREFAGWGDPERIFVNVDTVYRELDPARPLTSPPELFVGMARWIARH